MLKTIKVILEQDGRLRPLEAIPIPGDGSRELAIIVLPHQNKEGALADEEFQFIESISQDALADLWEGEEEDVWGDL